MGLKQIVRVPRARARDDKTLTVQGRAIIRSLGTTWGWLPALSLLSAIGLFLVAIGFNAARQEGPWSDLFFWLGLLTLFCPVALRLSSTRAARYERIGAVVVLGLSLYFVKVLHSPLYFTFYDEFLHLRTLNDLLKTGLLFEWNSLLPASPLYPGLEISADALISLSRSDVFSAGVVLVGLARLTLVLALFLFYEEISRSARVAGIAALLYMVNPTYVYFDSQFAYESLAVPLAIFVLYVAVRRNSKNNHDSVGYSLAALVGIITVVVTHHVTSYLLIIFLILWGRSSFLRGKNESEVRPGALTPIALVVTLTWITFIAVITLNYLHPFVVGGPQELWNIIIGGEEGRKLFHTWSGELTPLFDQFIGYGSVLLILSVLPIGIFKIWKSQSSPITLALAVATLAYPLSLAFRLTYWGAEASSRTSASVFVAIAFVLAVGVVENWLSHGTHRRWRVAFVGWAALVFMGGVIVGTPWWQRMPGPYLVVADKRSIEPQGIVAAEWARIALGPGNRISTDRINSLLMGTYGDQYIVKWDTDGVLLAPVFTSLHFGASEQALLRRGRVQYLVVDHRLSSRIPMAEAYFEPGEPGTYQHRTPIDHEALTKFDQVDYFSRIFDSGDIVIYDVGGWADVP